MVALKPVGENQFLVLIGGQSWYFTEVDAPGLEVNSFEYADGQTGVIREQTGTMKQKTLVLRKPYDPVQDASYIAFHKSLLGSYPDSGVVISITPVLANRTKDPLPGATADTYTGCIPKNLMMPKVDQASNNQATLEVEWIPYDNTQQ